MSELWVPITIIVCLSLVIAFGLFLAAKHKKQLHVTLQKHLENGGALTPDLLAQLGVPPGSWRSDLRKSLVLLGFGLACLTAGWIADKFTTSSVLGVFPIFIGFAFGIMALINRHE